MFTSKNCGKRTSLCDQSFQQTDTIWYASSHSTTLGHWERFYFAVQQMCMKDFQRHFGRSLFILDKRHSHILLAGGSIRQIHEIISFVRMETV